MPDPILQATALRYAAGDLTPSEATAFESRLAQDQNARDALAEAVRLSAQAIGQTPPTPHPAFRDAARARLNLRAYREHPFAWVGLGAVAVAACTLLAVSLTNRTPTEPANAAPFATIPPDPASSPQAIEPDAMAAALAPAEPGSSVAVDNSASGACGDEPQRSVAEIWADLSSHESVEKARDDELRWRQRVRDLNYSPNVSSTAKTAGTPDVPAP